MSKFIFSLVLMSMLSINVSPAHAILNSRESAPEINPALAWLNAPLSQTHSYHDRITVLYFWQSSNSTSLDGLTFMNSLHITYQNEGIQVWGVHCPNFEYERNPDNIQLILNRYQILLPVILDTANLMRGQFLVQDTPSVVLIDASGRIQKIWRGYFSEQEIVSMVTRLSRDQLAHELSEWPQDAGSVLTDVHEPWNVELGYSNATYFGNIEKIRSDEIQSFAKPAYLQPNRYYLKGEWRSTANHLEFITASEMFFIFNGASLSFVMESAEGNPAVLKVFYDDKPLPKEIWGLDIQNVDGATGTKIQAGRIYQIINNSKSSEPHEIHLLWQGTQGYVFRFTVDSVPLRLKLKTAEENPDVEKIQVSSTLEK